MTVVPDAISEEVGFVADTHLIRVLGEQLITSEKVGILELVKNSYDAGATYCKVMIENVPILGGDENAGSDPLVWSDPMVGKLPGPVITILDNGSGMDRHALVNGWLRPATTLKTSLKQRLAEERKAADLRGTRLSYDSLMDAIKNANHGRLVLGEKGVGRFATHRLGRYLVLNTKVKSEAHEWKLVIDWSMFDEIGMTPVDLSSVRLQLIKQQPELDYGPTNSGTRLRIYGGREGFEWSEETLRDIGFALALLRSPSKAPAEFAPEFICPQLRNSFEILTDTVPAPFRCYALVDADGMADIELRFTAPESLAVPLADESETYRLDLRLGSDSWRNEERGRKGESPLNLPECGPFFLDIKCWIRRSSWIHGADTKAFVDYLERFGGIGIYRNGLSILPTQDGSKGDWLGIERQIIKKGSNISYYNLYGGVEITQEENPLLIDKTNREGLINTVPYRHLALLVGAVVGELNRFVQSIRKREERLGNGEVFSHATLSKKAGMVNNLLENLAKNYDFSSDSSKLLSALRVRAKPDPSVPIEALRDLKKTIDSLRNELDRMDEQLNALMEVAGFAISVGVALHEIEKITQNLYQGLKRISRVSELGTEISERATNMSNVAHGLLNELRRIAPLRVTRLEQKREFSIRDSIVAASGAFIHAWERERIHFEQPPKFADFSVIGSFAACSQVFANLFDNSTYWISQTQTTDRKIAVAVYANMNRVIVADSGPGISDNIREHLFEPFFSLKSPPSGLGLYICRYYMRQLKRGDIREARPEERMADYKGAQFVLIFPPKEDGN